MLTGENVRTLCQLEKKGTYFKTLVKVAETTLQSLIADNYCAFSVYYGEMGDIYHVYVVFMFSFRMFRRQPDVDVINTAI